MQIITNQFQKEVKQHGDNAFPMLVSHEKLSNYESCSFLWHWHPEIEFTVVQHGEMIYQVNHQSFHLKKGDVLLCNANALHTGHMFQHQDCEYLSITLDPKLIYGFQGSLLQQKYVDSIVQNFARAAMFFDMSAAWHQEIKKHLTDIASLYETRPMLYPFDIMISLQSLWKTLCLNSDEADASTPQDKISYTRIREMMHYVELHYMEKISLEDMSALLHLSPSECSRLFKRYMNLTLFSFLQEYRIERSIELLADETNSITEIAAKVGFSDSNYFTKIFLKLKGCTPSAFRKELLHRITLS